MHDETKSFRDQTIYGCRTDLKYFHGVTAPHFCQRTITPTRKKRTYDGRESSTQTPRMPRVSYAQSYEM